MWRGAFLLENLQPNAYPPELSQYSPMSHIHLCCQRPKALSKPGLWPAS